MQIDLDKPAFGKDALKIEETQPKETVPEETTPESQPKVDKVEDNAPSPAENGDETRIPYSRFKKVHEKALEAEREAEFWRKKAEETQTYRAPAPQEEELPTYWVNLFGDSDASREAYKLEQIRFQNLKKEALEEFKREQETIKYQQEEAVQQSLSVIEEGLETVSALAGRDLSEKEKEKILDIIDEYSPKDKDGNYVAHIPFEKAWDIFKVTTKSAPTPAQKQALQATATDTEGEAKLNEKNKNFNPLDWNSYRRRI